MDKQWWAKAFNTAYMITFGPALAKRALSETIFIHRVTGLAHKKMTILDLACGFGRHAIGLAKLGHTVYALDSSEEQLSIARSNAASLKNITFIKGDMRNLLYAEKFDLVICMYSSLGYFDDNDNQKVISEMYKVLKPGGKLLLDVVNAEALIADIVSEGSFVDTKTVIRRKKSSTDGLQIIDTDVYHPGNRLIYFNRHVFKNKKKISVFDYYMRHYTRKEYEHLLKKNNFITVRSWGDYDGSTWTPQSWRTIVLAKKPQYNFGLSKITHFIEQAFTSMVHK